MSRGRSRRLTDPELGARVLARIQCPPRMPSNTARTGTAVLAAVIALAGCAATPSPSPSPGPTPAHWTYEGEDGPEHWGELSADYAACAIGQSQSPIDVADPAQADLANITFDYRPAPLEIVNNGHTVQVNYTPGSLISLDGKTFELRQFHFHAPSEHHVNGAPAAAELHLVHGAADGTLAVVGVLLTEGAPSSGLAPVMDNLPPQAGPAATVPGVQVDAAAMLPQVRTTYRYPGSLTTPPCTEGVAWLLVTQPLEISAAQLAAYTAIY